MYKSVLAAGIACVAILAGGSANATSIPFDDLAIRGNDTGPQTELLANAGELNWKVLTVSKVPDLLHENAGLGHVILQVNEGPTPISNSNSRPTPTPTTGSPVQVPEPGTLLLLISGLLAMGFLQWQRRMKQTPARLR
jgi:hypothetical protein